MLRHRSSLLQLRSASTAAARASVLSASASGLQTVAIIPCRGGSKRIPRKNLRVVAGKPLLQYTLAAAHESAELSGVWVATDSDEIAAWGASMGALVAPLPSELCTDTSPVRR